MTPPPQLYQGSVLHCSVPIAAAPLDPQLLYQQTLAVPQGVTLQCQLLPVPCGRQLLNCHLLEQQGDVLILDLVRLGQYGTVGVFYSMSRNVVHLDRKGSVPKLDGVAPLMTDPPPISSITKTPDM